MSAPEMELHAERGDVAMRGHMCTLPVYWTPYVAVGTTYSCPDCGRKWFLNEDGKWQSEEDR